MAQSLTTVSDICCPARSSSFPSSVARVRCGSPHRRHRVNPVDHPPAGARHPEEKVPVTRGRYGSGPPWTPARSTAATPPSPVPTTELLPGLDDIEADRSGHPRDEGPCRRVGSGWTMDPWHRSTAPREPYSQAAWASRRYGCSGGGRTTPRAHPASGIGARRRRRRPQTTQRRRRRATSPGFDGPTATANSADSAADRATSSGRRFRR